MPINPMQFTHGVCDEFLRYLFSAFPLALPAEAVLTKELDKTQRALEQRGVTGDSRQRTLPPKRTQRSPKKSSKRKA